ncbi:PSP1 domain-containing protein [Sphingobacterium bambusae]|uniref:Stage 0 sporulation family protein n=1 Tax=Sphingobacterium bambusae TaxID=662858 RepID=A0ABW6BIU8_9SPHI|nr:regulatory iron-sulfur-containing complex subunit RicT [Sphingobacterium bambusae]WPL51092.1 regulatory iron-sulfur-containing complex subunit RicT [Sphingobacterium bambusae]
MTSGCNKLDVYDWLSDMDLPSNYKPFNIVEVRFKGSRKDFYINTDNLYLEMGEMVAVEPSTGGFDIGHVSLTGELVRLQLKKSNVKADAVLKKIYRKANEADVQKYNAAKDLEWETMHRARNLALELGLSMKISDVDYQGDKTKATFYYTAEGRVDFRELIKRMAEAFRIRIEMRQIGMRQEASRLGGIGSCGRELCCSTWLTDFKTVSTSAARYQNLSLNTLKLAGQCGKLKCCLNYELDSYMDALRDIPTNVERLDTEVGIAYLQKTDIFKKVMWYAYPGAENWIPLDVCKVKEYAELNREGRKTQDITVNFVTEEVQKPISYDYENVVGQDSLTRLDDKNKRKKRKKPKGKREPGTENKGPEQRRPEAKKTVTKETRPAPSPRNEQQKDDTSAANKPKKKFNRNKNRNRNKGPENNKSAGGES